MVDDQYSNTTVMILAGGFGSRLKSVLGEVPKPLAPVRCPDGEIRPFLFFLLSALKKQGFKRIILSLHHAADQFKSIDQYGFGEIIRVVEPRPLGTGGAIRFAISQTELTGKVLVLNGDTWLGVDYRRLISESANWAMALCRVADVMRYGQVKFNSDSVIESFLEKDSSVGSGWINAGAYCFHSNHFLDAVKTLGIGQVFSIEKDVFPKLVERRLLRGVQFEQTENSFIDIGIPSDYELFKKRVLHGELKI